MEATSYHCIRHFSRMYSRNLIPYRRATLSAPSLFFHIQMIDQQIINADASKVIKSKQFVQDEETTKNVANQVKDSNYNYVILIRFRLRTEQKLPLWHAISQELGILCSLQQQRYLNNSNMFIVLAFMKQEITLLSMRDQDLFVDNTLIVDLLHSKDDGLHFLLLFEETSLLIALPTISSSKMATLFLFGLATIGIDESIPLCLNFKLNHQHIRVHYY